MGTFNYCTSYLKDPSAFALDPIALPLRAQEFRTTLSNGVFGALLDAMPDDWGRYVIDKLHGQQVFPANYMLHTSGDSVGNIAFSHSRTDAPRRRRAIGAEDIGLARAVLLDLESPHDVPPELVEQVWANTAMGGARPKLTVEKEGRLWLAKFPSGKDDPLVPIAKLEAAVLDLARRCGIDSVRAHVVHDDVLLVERFDRGPVDGDGMARRDAFLSARTLFECTGFRSNFGGSYVQFASELRRYSCQSAEDQAQLFRRMVFNALISNTDDHERNHGLVADDMPGSLRLAPAYDMVPRAHGTRARHQAMVVGKGESIATKENLLGDCEVFASERKNAETIFEEVADLIAANWRQCVAVQGLSEACIARMQPCFSEIQT
ncbi:type II toxin-antitoxin system HipA family toxin [Acidovorax sp. LjRoot66]|uniref:type II toxin-antitoxin system HipA family toxin n=1 Tax=Acidovorax sp. LjRoot66 TaxID=3342334 RepID=UPI003ECE613A